MSPGCKTQKGYVGKAELAVRYSEANWALFQGMLTLGLRARRLQARWSKIQEKFCWAKLERERGSSPVSNFNCYRDLPKGTNARGTGVSSAVGWDKVRVAHEIFMTHITKGDAIISRDARAEIKPRTAKKWQGAQIQAEQKGRDWLGVVWKEISSPSCQEEKNH